MSIKTKLILTLPPIFTGDERKLLEDWINNVTLNEGDLSDLKSAGNVHHAGALLMEAGYGSVSFDAMQQCQDAGLTPLDFEQAVIRAAFGSVWAVLKYQDPEVRESVAADLLDFTLNELAMLVTK